ncbi:MAG: bifunctional precorrin-2 dehydrogenase/sirohydrochlorin ferrochelatase [Proteobacteria bacterium]|nr:bifunctional precorrin-2 dehydrogenase/sirohydrochlorin ferrochelatase [Pseudomonadota bacterium]MBU1708595.1 bifunctional precorrin-2 dehydrogenase/sirohydrochlorin ferrochelatase [Pseudomonadota bacterium]
MSYFPICLDIRNRYCIVIGGGNVAQRKVHALIAYGGKVTVISPEIISELAELQKTGKLEWIDRAYQKGDLTGAFLVIAATDDPDVQATISNEAEEKNILLNVADVPKWCNFILPATIRRGDLTVSFSTAGKSPALARKLRKENEERFGEEYEILLKILGEVRETVLAQGRPHEENKTLFHNLLDCDMLEWIKKRDWGAMKRHLKDSVGIEIELQNYNDDGVVKSRSTAS